MPDTHQLATLERMLLHDSEVHLKGEVVKGETCISTAMKTLPELIDMALALVTERENSGTGYGAYMGLDISPVESKRWTPGVFPDGHRYVVQVPGAELMTRATGVTVEAALLSLIESVKERQVTETKARIRQLKELEKELTEKLFKLEAE